MGDVIEWGWKLIKNGKKHMNKKTNYFSSDFVDNMLLSNSTRYNDTWTCNRNKEILNIISNIKLNNIFEFAGGTGALAKMLLEFHPEIKSYIFSDYSPIACKLAKDYLKEYNNVDIKLYDIIKDLDDIMWKNFDLFICTSMEHFPDGVDIEILKRIPKGANILWGFSTFPACTHQHIYPNIEYVVERFKYIVDIDDIFYSSKKRQISLYGKLI